jgi:hypothetical protein
MHGSLGEADAAQQRKLPNSSPFTSHDFLAGASSDGVPSVNISADLPLDSPCAYVPALNWSDYLNDNSSDWLEFTHIGSDPMPQDWSDNLNQMPANLSFHFLNNFTSRTGFLDSFECGTQEMREQVLSASIDRSEETNQHFRSAQPLTVTGGQAVAVESTEMRESLGLPSQPSWLHDTLDVQTHQIVTCIKDAASTKLRNSIISMEWSDSVKRECYHFFAPTNIRKLLELYWAVWHPNINFLHRPTFDAVEAEPTLLASMTLIGTLTLSTTR